MSRVILKIAVLVGLVGSPVVSASDTRCAEVASWVAMMNAQTVTQLEPIRSGGLRHYEGRLIYALRRFDLEPTDESSAVALLDVMPRTSEAYSQVDTLSDARCDHESMSDMRILGRVSDRLASRLADAVLRHKASMTRYLSYVQVSAENPHGAGAVHMRRVCLADRESFAHAVNALPKADKEWFMGHLMTPNTCKILAVPEAE